MNELIAQKELSYAHISAALNAIGMRPEEWSKGGLIALGYSTKLIEEHTSEERRVGKEC